MTQNKTFSACAQAVLFVEHLVLNNPALQLLILVIKSLMNNEVT